MKNTSHKTPAYIIKRLKVKMDERANPKNPWLTKDAVDLLDDLLKPTDIGVEFGSGRSTKWFHARLKKLHSVEHDKSWFEKVKADNEASIRDKSLTYNFMESVEANQAYIANFVDNTIDFALVDGAWRDVCALEIVPKLTRGGLLVVDNVNWFVPNDVSKSPNTRRSNEGPLNTVWADFLTLVKDWRYIHTSNGVTDTGIWIKR